jgi:hypothetical protein
MKSEIVHYKLNNTFYLSISVETDGEPIVSYESKAKQGGFAVQPNVLKEYNVNVICCGVLGCVGMSIDCVG